jgi:hypothetical protein
MALQNPSRALPVRKAQQAPKARKAPQAPTARKAPKAQAAAQCEQLEQLPNIGPSIAGDLRLIGIHHPAQLAQHSAFELYQQLCRATGKRHDPCVLDTFMAAVAFMRGGPPQPWWSFTAERKRLHGAV